MHKSRLDALTDVTGIQEEPEANEDDQEEEQKDAAPELMKK